MTWAKRVIFSTRVGRSPLWESEMSLAKEKVTPGTSALFLMTSGEVMDKIAEAIKGQKFEIVQTNLTAEQEAKLRAEFGKDQAVTAEKA